MDFPHDIATNVFGIDGIKEIGWAFYSKTYHDQAGLKEDLLDDDGADIEDSFHFAECVLRERGKHVLLDEDDPGIWVFSLSKSEEDGVSQFLNSVGLGCSRSGLVQAVDLTGASRQDGPVEKHENIPKVPASLLRGPGEMNTHALGMHIKSESQAMYHGVDVAQNHNRNNRQNLTIIEIYPRMVAAISQSLSYSVADYEDFLRVGSYTFIESRTLGERLVEDLALHWTSAKTSTISLGVEWLSSGNLIISYSRGHMPRLCRVSHFLSENRRSGLSPEVPLLLSPSGATARFHGLEETPKTHSLYRSIMEHKSSISARLARSGVLVPQDSSWLRVLVEQNSPGQDGKRLIHRPKNASITLWPACLCLCADPGAPDDDRPSDLIGNSTEHGSMDALASAESWLLGKAARLKALEVQRRKDESEIQKTKETQDTDDDDDLSDIELQPNPYNASQDVSGIYPTPPDGIPANILDSSPNNNPRSSGIDNEEDQGCTPGALSRPYEEHGNEDIYGEMDIDVFASNGLTEADFSFFDEPGMNDGMLQEEANQIMVDDDLEGRIITNPAPATLSSDDNVVQLLQENQDGSAEQKLSAQDGEDFGEQEPIDVVRDAGLNKETGSQDLLREDKSEIADVEEETPDELGVDFEEFDDESSPRQRTSFDAVRFRGTSKSFDHKYALRGRYAFDVDDLPMPSRPGEQVIRGEDILPQIGIARAKESSSEDDLDMDQTDGEPSTQSSDFPNEYDDADAKQQRQHQQSRKRNRDRSEDPDNALNPLSPASARETSAEGPETSLSLQTQVLLFTGTENQIKERLAIETKFDTPYMATFVGKDHTFVRIAQMVADQAVSGSDIYQTSLECISGRDPEVAMGPDQHVESVTRKLSSSCSKISKRCTIKEYASLGDRDVGNVSLEQTIPQQKQRTPKPSYPIKPSPAAAQALFKLQAPYTCVRRTGTPIDISASALRFWEELSLAPAHGRKNVKAFCIFPANVDASDDVTTFLNMIKGAYQSCNLGLHDLGAGLPDYIHGLVHVPIGEQGDEELLPDLNSACKLLGTRLGHLRLQGGNFVIYMVDSSKPNRTLPNLCAAFLIMFEAYDAALRESHIDDPNDMVLQILPSSLIFSIETIPMPAPADYRKLAFDVYDRCGPNQNLVQKSQPRYLSAPAVCLAKAMPKAIDLKLTPESSAPRLQSDNCLHIAYAWTPGDHWLTAAWTDNHGILSWNSCYCFGGEDKTPWESFTDIAKEIWDTTLDMIQRHAPWRIFLCKDRPADRRELDAWQGILMDLNKRQISTTFLTLDTDPLLDFPAQESTNRIPELASGSLTTPGATPQSNAASPDISGFGATPGGAAQVSTPPPTTAFTDHDADARLIDMTNETWGVLINSPFETSSLLNTTYSDSYPALASAYLIKRAGPRDEDGLTRVAIKVLHGQTGYRAVLKEVLGMYAGLALLARARSMGNAEAGGPARGVLPYHVAAARRAHAAVTATMRYGDG